MSMPLRNSKLVVRVGRKATGQVNKLGAGFTEEMWSAEKRKLVGPTGRVIRGVTYSYGLRP